MRLYNKSSPAFKRKLKSNYINFQLAPPVMHNRNAAERVISTVKDHFIVGLCSKDPDFPMQNWYRLLEQTEIAINSLRPSRLKPKISAYTQLNITFKYNRTPMPPPPPQGTRTLLHNKPLNRGI